MKALISLALNAFILVAIGYGQTWTQITSTPTGGPINALSIAPNGTVWCGTDSGLYYSTNSGAVWQSTAQFPTSIASGGPVKVIAVAALDTAVIVTVENGLLFGTGRLTGATFMDTQIDSIHTPTCLASNGDTVVGISADGFASISTDEGEHWTVSDSIWNQITAGFGSRLIGLCVTSTGYYVGFNYWHLDSTAIAWSPDFIHWTRVLSFDSLKTDSPNYYQLGFMGASGDTIYVVVDTTIGGGGPGAALGNFATTEGVSWFGVSQSALPADVTAIAYGLAPSTGARAEHGKFSLDSQQYQTIAGTADGKLYIKTGLTSVRKEQAAPKNFALLQSYPNPFNPTTSILYSIPRSQMVTITVYNVLGEKVANLFSGRALIGQHQVSFDGTRLSSGVYLCRLAADGFTQTIKMMLLK